MSSCTLTSRLRLLDISGCGLTEASGAVLGSMLSVNFNIAHLDVSDNAVGSRLGAAELAAGKG